MKVLPEKEFKELAEAQEFQHPRLVTGFIDKYTHEPVVPVGARTRVKTHEVGHEKLEHFPKTMAYFGYGRKSPIGVRETWASMVDDEVEAEIYSYEVMDKEVTPMVGMMAIHRLMEEGWEPYKAMSQVIGRMRKFGIETTEKDREKIARIIKESWREPVWGYEEE